MQEKICQHFIVLGKVQGVWFRVSTQNEARDLGLTGWVRNLPDGSVEVLACGVKEQLNKLYLWLHQGPEKAEVTGVQRSDLPWEVHDRFALK